MKRTQSTDSIAADVLATVPACILVRERAGRFRIDGRAPDFATQLFEPDAKGRVKIDDRMPFLDNFLVDAEDTWAAGTPASVRSGIWREGVGAEERALEAVALNLAGGACVLLVQAVDTTWEALRHLLQSARETSLAHQGLERELRRKQEILLCVLHDLKSPLAAIVGGLSLLGQGDLSEAAVQDVARRGIDGAQRQADMIRLLCSVFSTELRDLEAFEAEAERAPDLDQVARKVVDLALPAFLSAGVGLELVIEDPDESTRVVGQVDRLERVLANLLENALRHAPEGSTVAVRLASEDGRRLAVVEDEGPGVDPKIAPALFGRFARSGENGGLAGLGLYFCRATLERWGGSIEYAERPGGGSQFIVSLVPA